MNERVRGSSFDGARKKETPFEVVVPSADRPRKKTKISTRTYEKEMLPTIHQRTQVHSWTVTSVLLHDGQHRAPYDDLALSGQTDS